MYYDYDDTMSDDRGLIKELKDMASSHVQVVYTEEEFLRLVSQGKPVQLNK